MNDSTPSLDMEPPTGLVTFLFTDIESSTWLLQHLGEDYDGVLHEHNRLLRDAWRAHNGYEVHTEGDAFFVSFADPADALRGAVEGQLAIAAHAWPDGSPLRVRMGIHRGQARVYDGDYVGFAVHQAARIASAAHGGQVLISEDARVDEALEDLSFLDLGPHRLKDLAQPIRLYQVAHPELPGEFPPPRTLSVALNNFPIQVTTFVGREADIERLLDESRSSRIITLVGAGGIGKTRLALQVAAELIDDYPHGAWLIDLTPLSDPELVPNAIADALGVREQPGRPIADTVRDHLLSRKLLLLLDNCEHVVDAAAKIAHEIVVSCADVSILATSREPLKVPGEVAWRAPSLASPEQGETHDVATLARLESVRLFVQRARGVRPGFDLTSENALSVANVCRRLDGLPLAIELAAARISVMSIEEISDGLDDRFRLLTGGSRVSAVRQRTLAATVSWSYDLLSDPERLVLNRLSVFAGGWTRDIAKEVCADESMDTFEVIDLLANLTARSLVVAEESGGRTRYRMLETIRHYTAEKLAASGEEEVFRTRHLACWARFAAEHKDDVLQGPNIDAWIDRFDQELDNLRAAHDHSLTSPILIDQALGLAGDLYGFWWVRGHWNEGLRRLRASLDAPGDALPTSRVNALAGAAFLQLVQTDFPLIRPIVEEGVALCRHIDDDHLVGRLLVRLLVVNANLDAMEYGPAAGRASAEEAEQIAIRLGSPYEIGMALLVLANLDRASGEMTEAKRRYDSCLEIGHKLNARASNGRLQASLTEIDIVMRDFVSANARIEEVLTIGRDTRDVQLIVMGLTLRSNLATAQNDGATARAAAAEATVITREWGDRTALPQSLNRLGVYALLDGDPDSAEEAFREALAITRQTGHRHGETNQISWLAIVDETRGDFEAAAGGFVQALSSFEEIDYQPGVASVLIDIARGARRRGALDAARDSSIRSLALYQQLGDPDGVALALSSLALDALASGDLQSATRCFGAAHARMTQDRSFVPVLRTELDEGLATARAGLDPVAFNAAWQDGTLMSIDELLSQ